MKNTEQDVLKEAENQGVSLTKKQSQAIAELVDADLEASGGAMSKKARIGMYVGIGLGLAALGTGAGVLGKYVHDRRSGGEQGDLPAPLPTETSALPASAPMPQTTTPIIPEPAAPMPAAPAPAPVPTPQAGVSPLTGTRPGDMPMPRLPL